MSDDVHWHDAECGHYMMDLPLWQYLAADAGGPVLDVGAGTGRVTLDLAREGFAVTALDLDPDLLAVLGARARAEGLEVRTVAADATALDLGPDRFALVVVPMQTLQLLGGHAPRMRFLRAARAHLAPGGRLAAAIVDEVEVFEADLPPDLAHDGAVVYASYPVAIRDDGERWLLDRRRERRAADGAVVTTTNTIALDRLGRDELIAEALAAGFVEDVQLLIPATEEHAGSELVVLRAA